MSVHMASIGHELLAALQELLEQFDDGEEGGERIASITSQHYGEVAKLIARAAGS